MIDLSRVVADETIRPYMNKYDVEYPCYCPHDGERLGLEYQGEEYNPENGFEFICPECGSVYDAIFLGDETPDGFPLMEPGV